ncbi:MAG: T9SS type A sorting domain-containing protein [Ignavibacteriae bacterium]|nr:T9SS type A sorting domain-containing protein [Ignavibacteriota bacterium]
MSKKLKTILITMLFFVGTLSAQNVITITDTDIPVGSQVTFTSDNIYLLDGMVFVDSAAVLTIEPGTIIKAKEGQGNAASGLVVTRYGKIYAEGTSDRPIIFTAESDNLEGNLSHTDRGLWGGVVMLGQASTNNQTTDGLKAVEGVNEINAEKSLYGGTNDEHSSGVFKYVSIRHSGINVGDQAGNEIQGLTLGGVGSGTVIEYVESYASADDGFEFFGGTVNTRYMVAAFCSDDAFDTDEGFRGKGQFWFGIQAEDQAGRVAEMDGATGDEYYTPFSHPVLSNVTYIGAGLGSAPEGDGAECIILRDNTAVEYHNSIFTEYDDATSGYGLTIEDVDNSGSKTEDSRKRFENGEIVFQNNIWYNMGAGNELTQFIYQDFAQGYFQDGGNANSVADPMLKGISRTTDGGLDPRPESGSPALSGSKTIEDNWFVPTSYVGAFGGNNWLLGWTALDQLGYAGNITGIKEEYLNIIPADFKLAQNYPNPFNPTTTIEFAIPQTSKVQLSIYNVLGQEIQSLLSEVKNAGTYKINFNASELSSGTYFYRLQAGSKVYVNKMILMK